jgi:hypothetical protein
MSTIPWSTPWDEDLFQEWIDDKRKPSFARVRDPKWRKDVADNLRRWRKSMRDAEVPRYYVDNRPFYSPPSKPQRPQSADYPPELWPDGPPVESPDGIPPVTRRLH